eukprot:gene245-273_t
MAGGGMKPPELVSATQEQLDELLVLAKGSAITRLIAKGGE